MDAPQRRQLEVLWSRVEAACEGIVDAGDAQRTRGDNLGAMLGVAWSQEMTPVMVSYLTAKMIHQQTIR